MPRKKPEQPKEKKKVGKTRIPKGEDLGPFTPQEDYGIDVDEEDDMREEDADTGT